MSKPFCLGRSMLLTVVVACGIAIAWCFVAAWTMGLVQQARQASQPVEMVYVRVDGTPVIARYVPNQYLATQQILSLDGTPIAGDMQQLLSPLYLYSPQQSGGLQAERWSSRLAATNDGGLPAIYWYLVHDGRVNGHAYGVGYHSASRRIEGYFGRQGFSPTLPPRDEWFQVFGEQGLAYASTGTGNYEPSWSQHGPLMLLADRKLWHIDTAKREVRALADCPEGIAVGSVYVTLDTLPNLDKEAAEWRINAANWIPQKLLVRESQSLRIFDQRTGEQAVLPLPTQFQRDSLAAFELADERLLVVSFDHVLGVGGYVVAWLDRKGQVLEQKHVRFASQMGGMPEAVQVAWTSAVAAPMPLTSVLTAALYPVPRVATGQADSYLAVLAEGLGQMWPAILAVFAIGAVGAVVAYRRQRCYGLPHAAAWAALVFVLGVPGWIAYRLHRTWPALADCPSCRQPAPRHRVDCIECGANFPPPALKGIEVFA